MAETTNLSIRIDTKLKKDAEEVFSELGMNLTTAINIFFRQAVRQGRIPFEISLNTPNPETMKAMVDAENDRNMSKTFYAAEDLFKDSI